MVKFFHLVLGKKLKRGSECLYVLHPMKYHFKIFAVIHGFYFSAPHISVKPDILDSLLLLKQPWQGILRNLTDFE